MEPATFKLFGSTKIWIIMKGVLAVWICVLNFYDMSFEVRMVISYCMVHDVKNNINLKM